ncbi:hypothetical protein SI65_10239 [Aspergillus cristatus]|uniref:Uncharacterized protein n=1 Tax=Aspergillus cristatus TaxID=573508 RepID=A0A1E3B061_ASPCR|nr:hypothetical protein SI65_10239 [Aspergillus cristatus]
MPFRIALESGLGSQGAAAAGLGILLHWSIFCTNFPAEDYMYTLFGLHVSSLLAAVYAYWAIAQFSLWHAIMRVGYLSSSFNVGLLLSISVYRLFFHRLRHFPGPLGSKLTRFYDAYLAAKDVQYNVEIGKLHDKYGNFVRTGSREVSIVRKSAVSLIFGPQSKCRKSTWYAQVSTDPKSCSIHHTRDVDDHRKRRKAWDRGLSVKALGTYEPRVKAKVDLLSAQIGAHLGRTFDATAWPMFLSFDIMGEVSRNMNTR